MVSSQDILLVLFLAFLETILSLDNALVLALMVRHLPPKQQRKALTYGLGGSVVFRLLALLAVTTLVQWAWVRYLAGAYLVFMGVKHFLGEGKESTHEKPVKPKGFWPTVVRIELVDMVFAIDSIFAAVALSRKLWVVFTGAMIGVVMMRFAASGFVKVLRRFPSFETSAFLMVLLIGLKVILETAGVPIESASQPAFIVFWLLMLISFALGFRRK